MTNYQRAQELATFAAELCTDAKTLLTGITSFLQSNTAFAIDWANETKPANLNEDIDGNLDGLHFSRTEMANVINSLSQIKLLLTGQSVSTGDHLGNLEKLAQVGV
jgi:hypothetical protein